MNNILEVKCLNKKFGNFTAVDNISFSVKVGEVVGFLGPNGAGKTTTIQILMGVTLPTSGNVSYFEKDFFTNKNYCLQKINFASAFNTLLGRITVWENLVVFSHLYRVVDYKTKIMQLVRYFESEDLLDKLYWNLSAGQRTRINIIKALINDPELVLMDEPTASLDPDVADKTLTLIEELKEKRNLSILYTSHNMDEITRICDKVIFLNHGSIVAQDTPLNLTKKMGKASLVLTFDGKKEIMDKYLQIHELEHAFLNNFIVSINTQETKIPELIFKLSKIDLIVTNIEIKKPTLEDFFLQTARSGQ